MLVACCAWLILSAHPGYAEPLLQGEISNSQPTAQEKFPDGRGMQLELAHEHTIGMRDIGKLRADLQLAEQTFNSTLELYNEGLMPRSKVVLAKNAYQQKHLDLVAREDEMKIDEAAIYEKYHHTPPFEVPVLTSETIDRVLNEGAVIPPPGNTSFDRESQLLGE